MPTIPDSVAIREMRARDATWRDVDLSQVPRDVRQGIEDRRALLALVDDFLGQAHEGIFAQHDCPALFACAYMIAQADAPEESSVGKEPKHG